MLPSTCNSFTPFYVYRFQGGITSKLRLDTLAGQTFTLPGQTVTLPSETFTLPSQTATLPGQTATLPRETATLPRETATVFVFVGRATPTVGQ